MFILDVDDDAIVDANHEAERLLGYARDELRSEVSISDVHPDDMDQYETFLRRVRDDDLGRRERFTCVTKAGEHRDCEISVATTDLDRDTYQIATVRELTQPSS